MGKVHVPQSRSSTLVDNDHDCYILEGSQIIGDDDHDYYVSESEYTRLKV
ncbi:14073_t:CDS:2 [Entrophospora sp. SA101]|nr:14073_t:CDS:2 [Entrophospora sp. SA101]